MSEQTTQETREIRVGRQVFKVLFPALLPRLSAEDRRRLQKSIEQHGIKVPVVVDEDNGVIDGINRLEIADELDLPEVPLQTEIGLGPVKKRIMALELNVARRHLSAEQVKELITHKLKENPKKPDVQVAGEVGVSDKTVAGVRKDLERRSEIPNVETRTDSKGREQPAHKPTRPKKLALAKEDGTPDPAAATAGEPETVGVVGNPIPDRLKPVFEKGKVWKGLVNQLNAVKRDLHALSCDDLDGAHLKAFIQQAEIDIENVKRAIRMATPYTVCPNCDGEGCSEEAMQRRHAPCKMSGWITEEVFGRLSEEKKEKAREKKAA